MGAYRHRAIVVTTYSPDLAEWARNKAELFAREAAANVASWGGEDQAYRVSQLVPGVVNSRYTFLVAPDGSKLWWPEERAAGVARDMLVEWLRQQEGIDFVEMEFGGDFDGAVLLRHSRMAPGDGR